jgi:FlaG/FlaF family flagellin (archaellin)
MSHTRGNAKIISRILALMMMVAIVIAGPLVVYSWIMGYIEFSNQNVGPAIIIQSVANDDTDLLVYVQNVGEGIVQLAEDACLYVDGKLVCCIISGVAVSNGLATLGEGETATLRVVDGAVLQGIEVTVKVTPLFGECSEQSAYPAGEERVPPVFDHFEFDTISSPQTSGVPFSITIRAMDQYGNPFTGYSGANTLTLSGGEISPAVTSGFLYGVWTGEVTVTGLATAASITTVAHFNSSKMGISDTFTVVSGEVEPLMWSQTYGGTGYDCGYSVVKTRDGGYALAGSTASVGAGADDFWLIKTDEYGCMEWNRTYGGTDVDVAQSLVATSDGGYAIAGYTNSSGAGDIDFWLVKTDASGNMEWNRTYGGVAQESAYSLIKTSDGGYALAGYTRTSFEDEEFLLVKTDANGNMEWNQTYGSLSSDWVEPSIQSACSLIKTSDGGYAIAGYVHSLGAELADFWLIKTNLHGSMLWNETYGGTDVDVAQSLVATPDGGYAITGYTYSFGAGRTDCWLVKTDASGSMQWSKTYGGTESDAFGSSISVSDGGYALLGYTDSFGSGNGDFWLVRTDASGNMLWNETYGGTDVDVAQSLVATPDGGYAIVGYTKSFGAGVLDLWLVKTDEKGNNPNYSSSIPHSLLFVVAIFAVICKKGLFSSCPDKIKEFVTVRFFCLNKCRIYLRGDTVA